MTRPSAPYRQHSHSTAASATSKTSEMFLGKIYENNFLLPNSTNSAVHRARACACVAMIFDFLVVCTCKTIQLLFPPAVAQTSFPVASSQLPAKTYDTRITYMSWYNPNPTLQPYSYIGLLDVTFPNTLLRNCFGKVFSHFAFLGG